MNPDTLARRRALRKRVKLTAVALACSLAAVVCATILFSRQAQLVREATSQQATLSGWAQALHSVQILLVDAQSGQRGYILTGDKRYLAPYKEAVQQTPQVLEKLDSVPVVEYTITENVRDIHRRSAAVMGELGEIIDLYDRSGRDAAAAYMQSDTSQQAMDQLRIDVAAIGTALLKYRKANSARVTAGTIESQRLTIVTVAALAISVILAGFQIKLLLAAQARHQESLAASERFVRTITDNVPVRLMYLDKDRRFQFANKALCERLGKTNQELVGRLASEIMPPPANDSLSQFVQAAFDGKPQRFEHTDEFNGESRRFESYLQPDFGPGGDVRGVLAIGVDITHLKQVERALRDLTEMIDSTTDFVAQADWRGKVNYINPSGREVLGLTPTQSLEGLVFSNFYTPETMQQFLHEIVPAVKANGVWVGENEAILKGGQIVPVSHMVIGHRDASGRVARYSSVMRDISNEVSERRDLAQQTATLNSVIEAIPAMVAVWDKDLRFRLVNKAVVRERGKRRRDFVGRLLDECIDETEYSASLPWIRRALSGETVSFEKEHPGTAEAKHVSVTYAPLRMKDGKVGGVVGVAHDITIHREENVRLMILTERDPLTGLLNRAGFEKYLSSKTVQGDGASLAVLYIDLDRFKPINDRHGHSTGDEVLREFAGRLQKIVRPTDAVARLGGDEFGVVLYGMRDPEDAVKIADKVVEMASTPMAIGKLSLTIGASLGIAFDADAEGGWQGLVARADVMAYQAKARGRGQAALARLDEPTLTQRVSQQKG